MSQTKEEISKIKILYIEDDLDFARLVKSQLEKDDFEMEIAVNETIFKTLFRKFRPDIVMVDLELRGISQGIDIIHYINNKSPLFPIVVYSAHVEPSVVIETMKCGVYHHVGKDKSIPELIVMLKNAVKQAYRCDDNFHAEYKLSEITSYNIRNCILTMNGKEIQLKRIESRVLRQLCLHINDFVSPEELSMATWGIEKTHSQLHRYISELRKIIEPNDPSIKLTNKRGAFYLLECKEWKQS